MLFCQIWRWPDLQLAQAIRPVKNCQAPFSPKSEDVCINPFHYTKVTSPPLPIIMVPRCAPHTANGPQGSGPTHTVTGVGGGGGGALRSVGGGDGDGGRAEEEKREPMDCSPTVSIQSTDLQSPSRFLANAFILLFKAIEVTILLMINF